MLTDADRQSLLDLARESIVAAAGGRPAPRVAAPSPALAAPGAAFVTLRKAGELRGCIGHVEAVDPLWKSVVEMAGAAATRDSRFPPVTPEEAGGLQVEISVLSPMKPIRPEEVVVGTHGLYVRKGPKAGLLLPQVPVEWKWDREEFLRRTFEKAGLDGVDPSAEILGFSVDASIQTG